MAPFIVGVAFGVIFSIAVLGDWAYGIGQSLARWMLG